MSLNIVLIRSSFENVKPIAAEAVSYFYDSLFSSYPELKPIFENVDMEKQKRALIASLVRVVDGLDNFETLGPYLRSMGGRHVGYGVEEKHYAMVGKTLISTFRYFFGEGWTSELEDQWIMAIGLIADNMLEGAKQAGKKVVSDVGSRPNLGSAPAVPHIESLARKPEGHDLVQLVRQMARNILVKALEDEMDGEFMKAARKKANNILTQAIREEGDVLQARFDASKRKVA